MPVDQVARDRLIEEHVGYVRALAIQLSKEIAASKIDLDDLVACGMRGLVEAAERFDATRPVSASIGISMAVPADTVAALLRRADENAYRAKQAGGDRVIA